MSRGERTRVQVAPNGPVLVSGPVRIKVAGGHVVESDRFMVAICTCRRSKEYPLCDTATEPAELPGLSQDSDRLNEV